MGIMHCNALTISFIRMVICSAVIVSITNPTLRNAFPWNYTLELLRITFYCRSYNIKIKEITFIHSRNSFLFCSAGSQKKLGLPVWFAEFNFQLLEGFEIEFRYLPHSAGSSDLSSQSNFESHFHRNGIHWPLSHLNDEGCVHDVSSTKRKHT